MAIFFVNQKNTYKQERAGSYLWSPKFNKNGTNNSSYKLMKEVKKGDFIIHNAGGKITAISRVQEDCKSENKPNSLNDEENRWENDGWKVNTEYYDLTSPLPISDLKDWTKDHPQEGGAFIAKEGKSLGNPKQGYLFKLTDEQADYILRSLLRGGENEEVREIIDSALSQLH